MSDRLFYHADLTTESKFLLLDEDTSKHCIQVLRYKKNDAILLTNGAGVKASCIISSDNRKRVELAIESASFFADVRKQVSIAIAPTKNLSKLDWVVEKLVEIGIKQIIPIQTQRTEKAQLKTERLNQIITSAMLQSNQLWRTELKDACSFSQLLQNHASSHIYLAHCETSFEKKNLVDCVPLPAQSIVCIGPEGDFTKAEIELAYQQKAQGISLGTNRLRTETAALVAAVLAII